MNYDDLADFEANGRGEPMKLIREALENGYKEYDMTCTTGSGILIFYTEVTWEKLRKAAETNGAAQAAQLCVKGRHSLSDRKWIAKKACEWLLNEGFKDEDLDEALNHLEKMASGEAKDYLTSVKERREMEKDCEKTEVGRKKRL